MKTKNKTSLILNLILLSIFLGAGISSFINSLSIQENYYIVDNSNQKITYSDGMSIIKIGQVRNILNSLKPDYKFFNEAYFTDNKTFIENLCGINCIGNNKAYIEDHKLKSKIYIYVDDDSEITKEVLCHEIIHNFIYRDEYYHKFVYDLGEQGVCYEK